MKKYIALIIALSALSLAACGPGEGEGDSLSSGDAAVTLP